MSRDSYRDFADVYDAWQMLYPRAFSLAIAPRVVAAMKEHVVPNTVLADLACGTGIFPLWWQKTHPAWTVYGTDLSPAMIAAAKRAAREVVEKARTWLEPLAARVAGRKMLVTAMVADSALSATGSPGNGGGFGAGPAAPLSDELKARAMSDPGMQTLLELMPLDIKSVEPI